MAQVTFNIPDAIIPELQLIAQEHGYDTPKKMLISHIKRIIRKYRTDTAVSSVSMNDVNII